MIERVVNYEDIYLEEAKLELAEEFVCLHEDLDVSMRKRAKLSWCKLPK